MDPTLFGMRKLRLAFKRMTDVSFYDLLQSLFMIRISFEESGTMKIGGSDEVRETEKISSFSTSVSSLMVRLAHLMVPMEVLGGNTKGTSSSRTKSMGSTSWEDRVRNNCCMYTEKPGRNREFTDREVVTLQSGMIRQISCIISVYVRSISPIQVLHN